MTDKIASFSEAAVIRIATRLADDADQFARLLETSGEELSGPEALRRFASVIRTTNANMKAGNHVSSTPQEG